MLDETTTLGVLGCGTMGTAVLRGVLRAGVLPAARLIASTRRPETARALAERLEVATTTDALATARAASVVLLGVKPQQLAGLLDDEPMRAALSGKLVVSMAAGVRLEALGRWLPGSALVRAMPNTPCLIGQGMTALARGTGVGDGQLATVQAIFAACGRTLELDEKLMDVATALNGSGPAFVYLIIEALADGALMMGLRRDVALAMAAQMVQGAARMVQETGQHPAVLKDQVTTPGGTTIAGLLTLEDGRLRSVLARAVEEATRVATRLGQS